MVQNSAWGTGIIGWSVEHGRTLRCWNNLPVNLAWWWVFFSGSVNIQSLFLMTWDEIARYGHERRHGDGLRNKKHEERERKLRGQMFKNNNNNMAPAKPWALLPYDFLLTQRYLCGYYFGFERSPRPPSPFQFIIIQIIHYSVLSLSIHLSTHLSATSPINILTYIFRTILSTQRSVSVEVCVHTWWNGQPLFPFFVCLKFGFHLASFG